VASHAAGLLNWLERPSVDARFSLRGRDRAPSSLLVVGIDDESVAKLPQFPFSRRLHAKVLENLHAAGARLIVYDIAFDRPSGDNGADLALFEAARRAAPVVFGTSEVSRSGATEVLGGAANLASIGDRAADAQLLPDADGVLRHTLDQVNGLPTLAAVVSERIRGRPPASAQLSGGWIDFRGPSGTFHNLSFMRVLDGDFARALVRGKIVVVGATAPVLQDEHSTAAGSPMSGPEVQANVIWTALSDFPLRSPAGVVTVLLIMALALLVPALSLRLETLGVALVGLAALVVWSLVTQLAFDSGTVLDYSDPLAALTLATGGTIALSLRADSRERKRLRERFASGEDAVVEQVLSGAPGRALEPTAIIAGYRIESMLGRGGMGVVYRAIQLALERPVALKVIATDRAQDPVFRERFNAESRLAASIEHESVIPVYEAGEDDGLLFIAMRLVDGIDLGQLLAKRGALEPTRALRIVEQVAGALDAAHSRGLVHRDVKPANVLLTVGEAEHAYLTDFGIAKQIGAGTGLTRADQWIGTLDYVAPEQIRGDLVDGRADVYALACVLTHALTGQVPFPRDSEASKLWAHLNAQPPVPSQLRAGLPSAIDLVVARGMAKHVGERFATAGQLALAASQALGIQPVHDLSSLGSDAPRASSAAPASERASSASAPTIASD